MNKKLVAKLEVEKVPVDTREMQHFLAMQMVNVVKGNISIKTGDAICRFSQQLYNFAKLELDYSNAHSRELPPLTWDSEDEVGDEQV